MTIQRSLLFQFLLIVCVLLSCLSSSAQIIINEASNRNFNTVTDEDNDVEDWIELYNAGSEAVNLEGYTLTDNNNPAQWAFTSYVLQPQEYLLVFCSGKNRFYDNPFHFAGTVTDYTPTAGWNTHVFTQPFIWDGVSDIVVNVCAMNREEANLNSIFYQSATPYYSTLFKGNDHNDFSCSADSGDTYLRRPNTRFNDFTVGTGNLTNTPNSYPAPYGNRRWCSRHQLLYKAEELISSGLSAGTIDSLSWHVASTGGDFYSKIDFSFKHVEMDELTHVFLNNIGQYFHTNFGIGSEGETIYLYNPEGELEDELHVNVPVYTASTGAYPNGSDNIALLSNPSPGTPNNASDVSLGILSQPIFTLPTGVYNTSQTVHIFNTDNVNANIYYTLNGDEPTEESTLYTGETILIGQSSVLRASAFHNDYVPSKISTGSYLINVNHSTPIVSIVVDNAHLYGENGIFDNWPYDWERYAYMTYFDSTDAHQVVFHRHVAMQLDGGAGGSRYHPQRSFRVEMDKSAFQQNAVFLPLLSNRPERNKYSRLYFRNGSNQWRILPYKDACLVELMAGNTHSYYSAMRPATVYINGEYYGLFEMREKLDKEYYNVYDEGAGSLDLLSVSHWYNSILRANEGNADHYVEAVAELQQLNTESENFLAEANQLFDLENLTDYIIGQCWVGNIDWPFNNIRMHKSDATQNRWRFTTVDIELSLNPNGWTDCEFDGLNYALNNAQNNIYILPWRKCMNNVDYYNYFINRFADLMNTNYQEERLVEVENRYYNEWLLEMPYEYERWVEDWAVQYWLNDFDTRHQVFQDELICKSETVYNQVENTLGLDGQFNLTLNTLPEGAGVIHLNTITPTEYPWTGIYYKGVPVQLTAEANEGYEFMHWINNGLINDLGNAEWNGAVDLSEIGFTAVFEEIIGIDEIPSTSTSLHVYPNPTKGNLYIENNERTIAHWEIYTAQGKLILQSNNAYSVHQKQIDVSDFVSGIYLVKIRYADGGSENKRWMKS